VVKSIQVILSLLFFFFTLTPLKGYPPSFTIGGYAEEVLYSMEGEPITSIPNITGRGILSWRSPLAGKGFFAVDTMAEVNKYLSKEYPVQDRESLSSILAFPVGESRMILEAGLESSISGQDSAGLFLHPQWKAGFKINRGKRKLNPFFFYTGSYLYQKEGWEDVLVQGGEGGFEFRPSIKNGYGLTFYGGWEYRPEYPLYGEGGSITGDNRRDIVFNLAGEADGLSGYFTDWNIKIGGGLRSSNANRYIEELSFLDERSECRVFLNQEGELTWSPHRMVMVQLNLLFGEQFYLAREALDADKNRTGENLRIFTTRAGFRMDWTPDDTIFLVLQGSGTFNMANDPAKTGLSLSLGGGVELSF